MTGETKVCTKCGEEKPLSEYNIRKETGRCRTECKVCKKNMDKIYYQKHREEILKYQIEYVKNNNEKVAKYKKDWEETNKDILKVKRKIYWDKNRIEMNKRVLNRLNNNPLLYLKSKLRKNLLKIFRKRGFEKKKKTVEILGCSFEEFKLYIELKFEPWMNWENRGLYNGQPNYGWDIDHITPLSTAKTEEDIIKLNHYTNLQPLCSYANRVVKRDKVLKRVLMNIDCH